MLVAMILFKIADLSFSIGNCRESHKLFVKSYEVMQKIPEISIL